MYPFIFLNIPWYLIFLPCPVMCLNHFHTCMPNILIMSLEPQYVFTPVSYYILDMPAITAYKASLKHACESDVYVKLHCPNILLLTKSISIPFMYSHVTTCTITYLSYTCWYISDICIRCIYIHWNNGNNFIYLNNKQI